MRTTAPNLSPSRPLMLTVALAVGTALGTGPVHSAEPIQPETVAELFARIDKNKDGKLSREETSLLPAIAERFATLDKDNDGFLNLDEFATGVRPDSDPPGRTPSKADRAPG